MSEPGDTVTNSAFRRHGKTAGILAVLATIAVATWMSLAGVHPLITITVGVLAFGFVLGFALYVLSDPSGFVKDLFRNLHF